MEKGTEYGRTPEDGNDMDDRIERYIGGRMSPEAAERFEVALLSDPELLADTRAAEALQDGLRALAAEEGADVADEPMVRAMAIAAMVALSITLGLLVGGTPRIDAPAVGAGGGAAAVELALTRGGAGPVIHLGPGIEQLELHLSVPGVVLAEHTWSLDGGVVGGRVSQRLDGGEAFVILDVVGLGDGDHRIDVVETQAGDLSFHFTTTH